MPSRDRRRAEQAARAAVRDQMAGEHARLAEVEEHRTALVVDALDAVAGRADALEALAAADARLGRAVSALTDSGLELATVAVLIDAPAADLRRAVRGAARASVESAGGDG